MGNRASSSGTMGSICFSSLHDRPNGQCEVTFMLFTSSSVHAMVHPLKTITSEHTACFICNKFAQLSDY
jgi:hypothetical protein